MDYKELKFKKGTKFLVTGGAGFIGSNLCSAILDMGYFVRCLDNFSHGKKENIEKFRKHPNFELIKGDIQDLDTCIKVCSDIDYVLHQAAWGSVPRSVEMPLTYEDINVKGTLNMLEAAKLKNIKRFVYASSSSVYGDSPDLPKVEGVEGKLLSPYAFTKHANEKYASLYTDLYNLETIGLRYFNVFGPKQDPEGEYAAVIPRFVKCLLKGEAPTVYGDGLQSRDFTYVENVIEANLKACLASKEATGLAYNIAYGGQETLLAVYDILARLLDSDVKPIFAEARLGDIKHSNADIAKARNLLGYDPKYSFVDGIELSVDWYRDNL